nr:T9SS type A sorting domain-containing protein [Saprospiraceae bacterium]
MFKNLLIVLFLFISHSLFSQQVISHNDSLTIDVGIPACGSDPNMPPVITSENTYFRAFDLSSFNINEDWVVSRVEFAVVLATGTGDDGYPAVVSLWENNTQNPFPDGNRELIEEVVVFIQDTNDEVAIMEASFENGLVPEGSELIVTINWESDIVDDGGNGEARVILGGNSAGQSAPPYIQAPGCGIEEPTSLPDINFPNAHLVIAVTGDVLSSSRDLKREEISVSPNPVSNLLNLDIPSQLEIKEIGLTSVLGNPIPVRLLGDNQIDLSGLPGGMYFLRLETNRGTITKRIVKK